jgi:hypothetical protein
MTSRAVIVGPRRDADQTTAEAKPATEPRDGSMAAVPVVRAAAAL